MVKRPTRSLATVVVLGLWLTSTPVRAEKDAVAIIQEAFEAAKANQAAARSYVFHERVEELRYKRNGEEKKRESSTWDVTLLDSSEYRQLIARNDRPLSARETAKEQKRLAKHIKRMQSETPKQRQKRLARIEKERQQGDEFLEEVTRAFDFRLIREELLDGIATHVISAEPKSGYVPSGRDTRPLTKLRATVWVAKEDYGWAKVEIETIGDFSRFAIFKLHKGARMEFTQRRHEDGIWLTEHWNLRARARVAQVKRFDVELTGTYSNFRKFTTDTSVSEWSVD